MAQSLIRAMVIRAASRTEPVDFVQAPDVPEQAIAEEEVLRHERKTILRTAFGVFSFVEAAVLLLYDANRRMLTMLMWIARLYLWRWLPGGKRARFYSINVMRARHPAWSHW